MTRFRLEIRRRFTFLGISMSIFFVLQAAYREFDKLPRSGSCVAFFLTIFFPCPSWLQSFWAHFRFLV